MSKKQNIELVYIGKRLNQDRSKLLHSFELNDEIIKFSGRFKNVWIGDTYKAEKNGDSITMNQMPERINKDEHKNSDEWRILSENAQDEYNLMLQKKKLQKIDIGDMTVNELIELGKKCKDKFEFIHWISKKIRKELFK